MALAQSSPSRTVTVPFAAPGAGDGYESGSVGVTYAFIACMGEMHIAYSLNEGSAVAAPGYRLGGKTYPATGAPPQPSSIRFAGTVYRGPQPVGSFADGLTGKALGMGCFTGQTQKIANLSDVVGPKATPDQVTNYFNSLRITVEPANTLRSAAMESSIRGELRRKEAEAKAVARKAEQDAQAKQKQEAQAKAQQEAEQRATAERSASAQQAAMQEASTAEGRSAPTASMPVQGAPAPLSQEQRIANAIASDKVLADQRLEQQRAVFAQQQAAMAAAEQQQLETIVAVAPAAIELGGQIYGALEAWDARIKARKYLEAQTKLAGKCTLPNGMAAPKDGDIRLGVELTADLSSRDCGHRPTSRYKAFKLELGETTRLQFAIKAAKWRHLVSYQIDVRDLENRSHMFMGWDEWGAIQKVNRKNAHLPAGVYIVTVSNGVEDTFAGFDLRVDPVDENWQVLATAPAPTAATVAREDAPTASPASPLASLTARLTRTVKATAAAAPEVGQGAPAAPDAVPPDSDNYLGMTIERDGEQVVVRTVDPGSPVARAGLMPGDVVQRMGAQKGLLADLMSFTDQAALDAWLAIQKAGARSMIVYRRDGKIKVANLSIGTRR